MIFKKVIRKAIELAVRIPRVNRILTSALFSQQNALQRIKTNGLLINTVIDVGASDGRWSSIAQKAWPSTACFLIEANAVHASSLQQLKSKNSNIDYVIVAAGDTNGRIYFDAEDPFGGAASLIPSAGTTSVPVNKIDTLVAERKLEPPFLVKLDTHGFEIPILRGAEETLKKTNLIVVETYNFKLTSDSLRFYEMCAYMEKAGFRCVDLSGILHRPSDSAFWQMDLYFIPASNRLFKDNTYDGTGGHD